MVFFIDTYFCSYDYFLYNFMISCRNISKLYLFLVNDSHAYLYAFVHEVYSSLSELCVVYVLSDSFISIEMEAVAEAVMDMQAILLENKTSVDKLEMWNTNGQ